MVDNYMYRNRVVWFGTRGYMRWVKAPDASPDYQTVGWSSTMQFLNGGAAVRSSVGSHREYNLHWNTLSRDQAREITDFADGVYDVSTGINPVYYVDPVAADKNVLPQLWATPYGAIADGITLVPGHPPAEATTPSNTLGYPARAVSYTAMWPSSNVYIPIPPGFTAWVGFHGSVVGSGGVVITPSSGFADGTPVNATVLSATTTTRVADSFSSSQWDGLSLSLAHTSVNPAHKTVVYGIIVQLLPTGATPETGGFISGQGSSGLQFSEKPLMTPRSAGLDQVSLSVSLTETESWY